MVYQVSHVEGRTRLKFTDLNEKQSFVENMKGIEGLKGLESNGKTLTVLAKYDPGSPFDYVMREIVSKEPEQKLSKGDLSSYISPLLKNPATKALWLILIFGPKVGFLQFSVSSMIVNKYIKVRFG